MTDITDSVVEVNTSIDDLCGAIDSINERFASKRVDHDRAVVYWTRINRFMSLTMVLCTLLLGSSGLYRGTYTLIQGIVNHQIPTADDVVVIFAAISAIFAAFYNGFAPNMGILRHSETIKNIDATSSTLTIIENALKRKTMENLTNVDSVDLLQSVVTKITADFNNNEPHLPNFRRKVRFE